MAPRSIVPLLGLLAGCTTPHTLITARHTPCKPKEIVIPEVASTGFGEEWYASCRDQWFRCTTREQGHRLLYACRRVAGPATSADAAVQAPPSVPDASVPSAHVSPASASPDAAVSAARAPDADLVPDAAL